MGGGAGRGVWGRGARRTGRGGAIGGRGRGWRAQSSGRGGAGRTSHSPGLRAAGALPPGKGARGAAAHRTGTGRGATRTGHGRGERWLSHAQTLTRDQPSWNEEALFSLPPRGARGRVTPARDPVAVGPKKGQVRGPGGRRPRTSGPRCWPLRGAPAPFPGPGRGRSGTSSALGSLPSCALGRFLLSAWAAAQAGLKVGSIHGDIPQLHVSECLTPPSSLSLSLF